MVINWSAGRALAALGLGVGFLVTATVLVAQSLETDPPAYTRTSGDLPNDLDLRGNRLPAVSAVAASAQISDDEPVIGVVVDGKPRAYRLWAFIGPQRHVLNDLVAAKPVTVTYCDLRDCVRVFAGDGPAPLDVGTGGHDRGLLLLVGGRRFRQESLEPADPTARAQFPLRPMRFERTTWKQWRDAHPDTDVVLDPSQARPPERGK
jgi:hypothetical protein